MGSHAATGDGTWPGCRWTRLRLENHVRGELPPEVARAVEQHLANCSHCRRRARFEGILVARLRPLGRSAVSPRLKRRVRAIVGGDSGG